MAKVKLKHGFGEFNKVPVLLDGRVTIGEMHMRRRVGWRGGPSYQFYPNAEGEALGLKNIVINETKVRPILKHLAEAIGG